MQRLSFSLPTAFALSVLAVACAPTAPGAGQETASTTPRAPRQCFDVDRVQSFRTNRDTALYIRTSQNRVYALAPTAGCQDLQDAMSIALLPGAGPDRVCDGDWVHVAIGGAVSPSAASCRARVEKQLTDAEIEALPARFRP